MTERNDRILGNQVEILGQKKTRLLGEIEESEVRMAHLRAEYDRCLAAHRQSNLSHPIVPAPSRKEVEKTRRLGKVAFRQTFRVGLVLSLLPGFVILLAHLRHPRF
jgi:hypothetical protein